MAERPSGEALWFVAALAVGLAIAGAVFWAMMR